MKVVILGKGLMLSNLILGAIDAGAQIVGVFRYDYTSTNKFKLFLQDTFNQPTELSLIKSLGLRQLKFRSANSDKFRKFLIKENIDLVIVGTWKEKLQKETFDIPSVGTINFHPSLLPKYRGPNPYMQTILHGEEFSGITMHLVDENYDTGAILAQKKIRIFPDDTSKELRERTVVASRKLLSEFILGLNEKIITPVAQNNKIATYYPNITGEERMLDFEIQTSEEISRTIRALHPFLPCYITLENQFYIVNPYKFEILEEKFENFTAGEIINNNLNKKSLTILCADGKAIKFNDLKKYK